MFSRTSKKLLGVTRGLRQYSTSLPKPNYWAIGGAIAATAAIGVAVGRATKKQSQPSIENLIPTLGQKSTSPLSDLESPQYATPEEYEKGIALITEVLGKDNVSFDKDVILSAADLFFLTHHPPEPELQKPGAVVYPSLTEQVSQIVRIANEHHIPIVANSGLTSLEGHNMHTRGPHSILISFLNMANIVAFHPDDLDVVVQPGVEWTVLDDFLQDREDGKHLIFGPDPGIGACIGGMTGTSASGTNAYRYGTMKESVLNVTVVLADGTVVKTRQRPRKLSAGYDLTHLFIGLEGTLGIVTEITLKLNVRPKEELVCIATFPKVKDAAHTALEIIAKSGLQLNAIEILNDTMMAFVNSSSDDDSKKLLEQPTLFLKVGGRNKKDVEEQMDVLREIFKRNNLISTESSTNAEESSLLWSARRNGLWSTVEYGRKVLPDKDDVQVWTTDFAVPISKMSQLIQETNDDLTNSGFKDRFSLMGHIGDGNCHFIIIFNTPDYARVQTVVDRMVHRAIKLEGTCTGEHGVGVGKRAYISGEVGETGVDLMRHLKVALDPRRILNPDKVFKIDPKENLDELLHKGAVHEAHPKEGGCC